MKKRLVAIKLGGGLITDKTKPYTALNERIQFAAAEVAKAYKSEPHTDFLLGTGAGSFGHFAAHEYGIREGAHTARQFRGMSIAHNGVRTLNTMFVDALLAEKVPGFGMSPASMMTCKNGGLDHISTESLRTLLKGHCLPVLHGDTIPDTTRGTTVLSTEKVLNACIEQLRATYDEIIVLYAMNENGILDASGQAIPEFGPNQELEIRDKLGHDVTGGIMGKIQSARAALKFADAVYIVSGKVPGVIQRAINGDTVGTKIVGSA